jgi:type II secretory pathway pseudopilin PulG
MTTKSKNAGFTLIELLLAMSFIAFLLLFMVAAILQVTKLYVKGSAIRQINQTGRQVVDDISLTLRNNGTPIYITDHNRLCAGNTSYAWNAEGETINAFDDGQTLRLISVQDPGGSLCASPDSIIPRAGTVDLVGPDITPLRFSVEQQGRLWDVSLVLSTAGSNIATADTESPTGYACAPDNQFCALGDFQTSVYSRGGK